MTDEEIAKICMDETGFDIDGYHLGAFAIADFARAIEAAAHGAGQREKELLAVGMEPLANLHDDGYWTSANTQAGRSVRDSLNHAGAPKLPVYTATQLAAARLQGAEQAKAAMQGDIPASKRTPLTDAFIHKVVCSKQPDLDTTCSDWKHEFEECKYWLEAAHGITGEQT